MKLRVWTHHFHLPDCSETRMNKKHNNKYTIMHWYVPEMACLEWHAWCVCVRIVTLLSVKQTAAAAHRATVSRTPHTRQTPDFDELTFLLDTITCGKGSAPSSRNWLSRSIIIVSVSPPKAQVKLCPNIRNCRVSTLLNGLVTSPQSSLSLQCFAWLVCQCCAQKSCFFILFKAQRLQDQGKLQWCQSVENKMSSEGRYTHTDILTHLHSQKRITITKISQLLYGPLFTILRHRITLKIKVLYWHLWFYEEPLDAQRVL